MRFRALLERPWVAAFVLVAAIAATYADSLHDALVWDDVPSIVQNPLIERLGTALHRPSAVNTTSGRPLVALSLAVNYALDGRGLVGLHLGNILIHAAAALALFGLVRRLALLPCWGGRPEPYATGLALAVAGIWALHPLQTQAVTYVIQRAESLMGLCYFLSLYLFLRSAASRRPRLLLGLAVGACAAGMAAKEVMVSAPVIILLFDRTFLSGTFRRALAGKPRFYGALFGTWMILAWLVISLHGDRGGSTGGFSTHAAWGAYWLTQFPAIATYLKLAFFPYPLVFQYGAFWLPGASAAAPTALIIVPLLALTLVALWRWPAIGFLGGWFFSILAVTSLVPGTADMIAEYRMYVALAPLWILCAAGLYRWLGPPALGLLAAAALAFAAVTVVRNRDYRSELALWTDDVAKRPDDALARYNLAVSLLREPGKAAEAWGQLEAAIRLQPDLAMAHYNLALLLASHPDQRDRAIREFGEAIRIAPGYSQAHNNLGVLLHQLGRTEEARQQFQLALAADSDNRAAWLNLVAALAELGRLDQATAAAAALVQAHPEFADGQARLGILLARGKRIEESVAHFEAAVRLSPNSANAQFDLAGALELAGGHRAEALAHYRAAAALQPTVAEDHFRIARLLAADPAANGEARAEIAKTLALDPGFPGARDLLAAIEAASP